MRGIPDVNNLSDIPGHSPHSGGFEARIAPLIGLSNAKSSSPQAMGNQNGS
jgi:hypothetical protein